MGKCLPPFQKEKNVSLWQQLFSLTHLSLASHKRDMANSVDPDQGCLVSFYYYYVLSKLLNLMQTV